MRGEQFTDLTNWFLPDLLEDDDEQGELVDEKAYEDDRDGGDGDYDGGTHSGDGEDGEYDGGTHSGDGGENGENRDWGDDGDRKDDEWGEDGEWGEDDEGSGDVYARRRALLRLRCREYGARLPNISLRQYNGRLRYETVHGFLYCENYKVGSTAWAQQVLGMNSVDITPG